MFSSNQVFAISGHDKKELSLAIKYALNYGATIKEYTPCCFKIDPVFGIVFYWHECEGTEVIPVYLRTIDCLCDLVLNALKDSVFQPEYNKLCDLTHSPDVGAYDGWLLYCVNSDEIENNYGTNPYPDDLRDMHYERWNGPCNWHYSSFAVKPYCVYYA